MNQGKQKLLDHTSGPTATPCTYREYDLRIRVEMHDALESNVFCDVEAMSYIVIFVVFKCWLKLLRCSQATRVELASYCREPT